MKTAYETLQGIMSGIDESLWNENSEQLIKDYARHYLKKQRKIIAKGLPDNCFMPITDIDEGHILNMDEPELK